MELLMEHLNTGELLDLFERRGIQVRNREKSELKLKYISYYKLKALAHPFDINSGCGKEPKYENLTDDELITRYYSDKKLRLEVLSCAEKIEVAFKTRFSFYLGQSFDSFGYYKFNNWCNKEEYCKHYISLKQGEFKENLKATRHQYNSDTLNEYFAVRNLDKDESKIPIWLFVEGATFGEILNLYEMMNTTLKIKIAKDFNCTAIEFQSWLGCIKLMRNKIAHNSNIIDLKFKTKPALRSNWYNFIDKPDGLNPSNAIAIGLFPLVFLTVQINSMYAFNDLQNVLNNICGKENDYRSKLLGFNSRKSLYKFIEFLGGHYRKINKVKKYNIKNH